MAVESTPGHRPSRWGCRAKDERGLTLPELLIAAVIGLLVIGGGVASFTTGVRSEPRISGRAYDIQQARTTMERISRELRQGSDVRVATASSLEVVTYVPRAECGSPEIGSALKCSVTYTCGEGSCTRTERDPNSLPGTGSPATVVSGLASDAVFDYAEQEEGAPPYIHVTLAFPTEDGDDSITLEDGVSLRNPETPQGGPS